MIDITVITRQRTGKVVSYYADGADDYYSKDSSAMQWQGSGADALNLSGEIDQKRFRELLNGRIDADTKLRRVASTDLDGKKERLGYDLTFSAPKGVSLQALVQGDHRVIEAHDKAVTVAVQEAERLAMARKTEKGKVSIEHTHKLVVGKFRHETSRAMDPDLHTHAFVMNMTQRADGKWRALTNDAMLKSLRHLGNVYKAELAIELEKAGFLLRYDRNGTFDLAHFTEHQIDQFSIRSQQIEAKLAKTGKTRDTATTAEKSQAALSTRAKKVSADRQTLRQAWQKRAVDLGIDFDRRDWAGAGVGADRRPAQKPLEIEKPLEAYADHAVQFAIKSLTERSAIVEREALIETALRHGYGRLTADDVRAALERATKSGHLIKEHPRYESMNPANGKTPAPLTRKAWIDSLTATGKSRAQATRLVDMGIKGGRLKEADARYTTLIALQRERDILRLEHAGRNTVVSRVTPGESQAFLATKPLNDQQRHAVEHVAHTRHQFIGVQGFAGVGKSHMTKAAKELLESKGYAVKSLAPYASQVKAWQSEGIDARTVQAFLRAKDKKIDGNTVVFVDEAGVIAARQMQELMRTIEAAGARAVFLGDTAQTKAIEAGKPFEQLIQSGMQTATLTKIQRQKNPELLKIVQLAAEGKADQSVARLSAVHSIEDSAERYQSIVTDYTKLSPADRANTLILTGTNASRKEINLSVQQALGLRGTGRTYELLNRLDTTQAERRHSKYYEKGSVILPERDYHNGLRRGQQYVVIDTGPRNRLTVRSRTGEIIQFSPVNAGHLSVYSQEKTELAVGDQVNITRNDAGLDLANGDRLTVKRVTSAEIQLQGINGRQVMLNATTPIFAALAYATTAHSAQGMTSDKVLLNIETASRTTTKEVYYVGVSRARHDAVIYTDDHTKLASAVSRKTHKTAALEIKQLAERALGKSGPQTPAKGTSQPDVTQRRDSVRSPDLSAGL